MRMPWWTSLPRDRFGGDDTMSDSLLALVLAGTKTATCCDAQFDRPQSGERRVLEDSAGTPRCVIETTSVELKRFNEMDADFARAEGEGDLSLEYWRLEHEAFFRATSGFAPDMLLACERFRVVEIIPAEQAR